jgi:hypothetical protein
VLTIAPLAEAQPGVLTTEQLIEYTPDWKGERFADGRPKVPDAILDRMVHVTLEEAWAVVTGAGFSHQFDDNWVSIHPDKVLVGRALIAAIADQLVGRWRRAPSSVSRMLNSSRRS